MTITNTFADLAGGDLDDFTPKARNEVQMPSTNQLQRVANEQGFTIDNQPVTRKLLKSGRVSTKDRAQPMTLRIRVADWNKFSAFCERNEYTVAEGFERLSTLAEAL